MSVRRTFGSLATCVICLLVSSCGIATAATPGEVTRFLVPGCLSGDFLAPATKAGVLLRLCKKEGDSEGRTLGNLLASGKLVRRRVPRSVSGPIVTQGADVWLGDEGRITRLPAAGQALTFGILPPGQPTPFGTSEPSVADLVAGRDGTVWAAIAESVRFSYGTNSIGGELVAVSSDGVRNRFRVPEGIEPTRLTFGSDGNLWFTGVKGRTGDEHNPDRGTGYIGRMTRSGEFTLFPVPSARPEGGPRAIAAAPDGRLWFTGPGYDQLGTIDVDGTFGPIYTAHGPGGVLYGGLTVGPEGDAWAAFEESPGGVLRVTTAGQQTVYPGSADAITTGREGYIWSLAWTEAHRIVPGGPGIDLWDVDGERASRKVDLELACGGSEAPCRGRLELSLGTPNKQGTVPKQFAAKLPFHLADFRYEVPAESRRKVAVQVPVAAFHLAAGFRHLRHAPPLRLLVRATVEGGPTMHRRASSATLAGR